MRVTVLDPTPLKEFFEPTLVFPVTLTYNDFEVPLFLHGWLQAEDGKLLCPLIEMPKLAPGEGTFSRLSARGTVQEASLSKENDHTLVLMAVLKEKALDYIDTNRNKNSKHDVVLKLKLTSRVIKSNAIVTPLFLKTSDQLGAQLQELSTKLGGESMVTYKDMTNYAPPSNKLCVISGVGEPCFLLV